MQIFPQTENYMVHFGGSCGGKEAESRKVASSRLFCVLGVKCTMWMCSGTVLMCAGTERFHCAVPLVPWCIHSNTNDIITYHENK